MQNSELWQIAKNDLYASINCSKNQLDLLDTYRKLGIQSKRIPCSMP